MSIGSTRSCCAADKMFQAPFVLVLTLVQLTVVSDDVHEIK